MTENNKSKELVRIMLAKNGQFPKHVLINVLLPKKPHHEHLASHVIIILMVEKNDLEPSAKMAFMH